MERDIDLDDLRVHLNGAKERISREKRKILKLFPLPDGFNREEYAFAYMRAERVGMKAINLSLAEIAWLPMQLDPKAELLADGQNSMKRWLTSGLISKPDSEEFGNDFIHALARGGLKLGWDNDDIEKVAARVAVLFRDLSCLIGLIYYCTWLAENNIEGISLTDPDNLTKSAEEVAALIQSPELYRILRAKEQDVEKGQMISRAESTGGSKDKTKARPTLRVIENLNYIDPYVPDPLPAH